MVGCEWCFPRERVYPCPTTARSIIKFAFTSPAGSLEQPSSYMLRDCFFAPMISSDLPRQPFSDVFFIFMLIQTYIVTKLGSTIFQSLLTINTILKRFASPGHILVLKNRAA